LDISQIFQNYGPYIGLPVIIYYLVNGIKQIPFFKNPVGIRFVHFIPVVLGVLGGLLLPEDTWQDKILVGGALGCLNIFIYQIITVSLAKKSEILEKIKEDEERELAKKDSE
jgi:hypothetical protein